MSSEPSMDARTVLPGRKRWAALLCRLLKPSMRLNITLAWRPLYDLINLIYFRKARTTPTPLYRNLGLTLVLLARKARRHVSVLRQPHGQTGRTKRPLAHGRQMRAP